MRQNEVGAGMGLGLSIAYGIIREHQGSISVGKSRLGEGAKFLIQLPLTTSKKATDE
jgi:signal transduction histidine kinase